MPSTSKKQRNFMEAVANNTKFAKKVGVPTSVGKEFTKSGGGMAKANPFMEMIAKKKAMAKAPAKKMASGGLAAGHKAADGVATKGKTKAKQVVMKKGGKVC